MRRREIRSPLISSIRHEFVVPAPPTTEPELSAYTAGKLSVQGDSPSCPNPNMTPSERVAFTHGRWAAGDPRELRAPLSWSVELSLTAVFVAATARMEPAGPGFAAQTCAAAHVFPVSWVFYGLKTDLERRRAIALGLTPETAPHPSTTDCVSGLTVAAVTGAGVRALGFKYKTPPWPRALATTLISEIARRRAWNAALRTRLAPVTAL